MTPFHLLTVALRMDERSKEGSLGLAIHFFDVFNDEIFRKFLLLPLQTHPKISQPMSAASLADETGKIVAELTLQIRQFASITRRLAQVGSSDLDQQEVENRSRMQQEALLALDVVLETDKSLQMILEKVNEQQRLHALVTASMTRSTTADYPLVDLTQSIYEQIIVQKEHISRSKKHLDAMKRLWELHLNSSIATPGRLLAFAQQLALTSGPPVGWTPDQPLGLHRPPYPTEDLMRASRLFQCQNIAPATSTNASPDPHREVEEKLVHRLAMEEDSKHLHDHNEMILDLDLNPDLA